MKLTEFLKTKAHWWIFLAVSVVAFSPCLFSGQVYFLNDLLAFFGPSRAFFKDQLSQGHFPLWNPYMFAGQPFFADLQNMLFYPFYYLTLPFSVGSGMTIYLFIHMFWAALGMYVFLKSLRLSNSACLIGALIYSLSGEFWWETIHPTVIASLAWIPWFLACLENLAREGKPRQAFLTGLCFAVLFSAGSFQYVTGAIYGGLAFLGFRWYHWSTNGGLSSQDPLFKKKLLKIALFGLWGCLPVLACAVPMNEFSLYSTRRAADITYDNYNGQFSMPPYTTYEFLFPTMGVPEGQSAEQANQSITDTVHYDNGFMGTFGYLGIWVPFLVFFAFKQKDKKFAVFSAVLAVLSLLTAWGRYFPLHRILCVILPVVKLSRTPFRYIDLYVIFVCVLGAYGFQILDRFFSDAQQKNSGWVYGGLGYGALLTVVSFARPNEAWREMLGLMVGMAGLLLWGWTLSWKKAGKTLFVTALLLPLFLNAWNDFGTGPVSNLDFQSKFPELSQLGKTYPLSRFILNPETMPYPVEEGGHLYAQYFPENTASFFGLRIIDGYNPLMLKNTEDLKKLPQETLVHLLAVRGIVVGRDAGEQKGFTHQTLGSLHLYQMDPPADFVMAPSQIRVVGDDAKQLETMKDPAFHPGETAILSADLPSDLKSQLSGQKATLQYKLLSEDPNHEVFHVDLDKNSLVVFSEINFPGWKARVDGKPQALFTADHALRSLVLTAGSHEVELIFEPTWFKPIVTVLFLWLLSAPAYLFFSRKKALSGGRAPAEQAGL